MKIVGIDPSLTGTGLATIVNGRAVGTHTVKTKTKGKITEQVRQVRLRAILTEINGWVSMADLVVIEGLAFDGHDTQRQLAGLHWILRHTLWGWALPVAVITPSGLKRFAVDAGGADKDRMLTEARESFAVEIVDHNAADALWLAEAGAAHLGCPVLTRSADRVSQIQGVAWPERDLAA